ncbi:MAG: hypothetical protein FGM42_09655 [Ilumatobacteraceae bacterium]|nr:hypothetical protein [Ilumatobacteraceae bacterium]
MPVTRICSPWVWLETPLGPFSLMSLLISRALSELMPTFTVTTWRTVSPEACSNFPQSMPFSDIPRFTNFSSRRVRTARAFSSLIVRIVMTSSFCSIEELVFLKSNRLAISRWAWSTALRSSWRSTSDTMSNEGMCETLASL